MECTAYAKSLGLQRLLPSALSPSPLLIAGGPADRLADGRADGRTALLVICILVNKDGDI
jgi:hypothetical protein